MRHQRRRTTQQPRSARGAASRLFAVAAAAEPSHSQWRCDCPECHALRTHATSCAMPTTHAPAVSMRLCTSLMGPANTTGLPCFLYACAAQFGQGASHLGVRALPEPRLVNSTQSPFQILLFHASLYTLCRSVLFNAHIKTGVQTAGQLVARWSHTWRCQQPTSAALLNAACRPTCSSAVLAILISYATPRPLCTAPIPSLMLGRSWVCSLRRPTCGTSCLPCTPPCRHLQRGKSMRCAGHQDWPTVQNVQASPQPAVQASAAR